MEENARGVFSWQKREYIGEFDPKSPEPTRRMRDSGRMSEEENRVLDAFRKLSSDDARRRVLDAMEDFMDEVDSSAAYREAAEHEDAIKQKKLSFLREEEEKINQAKAAAVAASQPTPAPRPRGMSLSQRAGGDREKALQILKEDEQRKLDAIQADKDIAAEHSRELHKIVSEANAEGLRQGHAAAVSAEVLEKSREAELELDRLRHEELEEKKRIHELEVKQKEQAEYGRPIGAHGAKQRDESNKNVVSETTSFSGEEKIVEKKPELRKLASVVPAVAIVEQTEAQRAPPLIKSPTAANPLTTMDVGGVSKNRNPRLANMMAMLDETPQATLSDVKGQLFGGLVMTPEVARIPQQQKKSEDETMSTMRSVNRPLGNN